MKLIVGLGNPGYEYNNTRHNIGFMVIDELLNKLNLRLDKSKFDGLYTKTQYHGEDVIILKPIKYMNLSGEVVCKFIKYFNINIDDIIVIYDDLDLDIGKIRLRKKGSSGGHNGIKNIIKCLNTDKVKRIKIGISRPKQLDTINYVLGHLNSDEVDILSPVFKEVTNIILQFINEDFEILMSNYN